MSSTTDPLVNDERGQKLIEARRQQGLPDKISDTEALSKLVTILRRGHRG